MFSISDFGKYKAIVISVAMFIFLDAGVLVLNFYISSQIAGDAVNVNLAGRQRMLSQKTVKALLDYQGQVARGGEGEVPFNEMSAAVQLFDRTLNAFKTGGTTKNAVGTEIYLPAVTTPAAVTAVESGLALWQPIKADFERLTRHRTNDARRDKYLVELVEIARQNNLGLLKLMNDLTVELESVARDKSDTLRMIQASAILLAILNFLLILFHFIGQLRQSDRVIEEARSETTEILNTVREGLLLVNSDLEIGTQYSESIKAIFGERDYAGTSFRDLLTQVVSEKDMNTAEDYIKLLLNKEVKENLIGSLNPLNDVEVRLKNHLGVEETKHLTFRFNRTIQDDKILHILVTVQDVSELVKLRILLEEANNREDSGLDVGQLKQLMDIDPSTLSGFLTETQSGLVAINEILREDVGTEAGYREKVDSAFRIMHRIKGDASALKLRLISDPAHRFESGLETLREQDQLQGGDFLPLTLMLNDLMSIVAELSSLMSAFDGAGRPVLEEKAVGVDVTRIEGLAKRIADESGKQIAMQFDVDAAKTLPPNKISLIQDTLIQLVRNSVVHGVEMPEKRRALGKDDAGVIKVFVRNEPEGLRVGVSDDGQGIQAQRIRDRALEKGLYTDIQLEGMNKTKLMSLIFEPGFSTAEETSEHAGRGVGMDVVRANVHRLKGRLRIGNKPGRALEISYLMPAVE